jgi:CRISPR/Cas system-associated endoribonuclease Cas2
MELGNIAGITGLAKNIDRVAEAQRGMATLQAVDQTMQKDKQESLMMQEMESKNYEEIANKASELLEPDRDKIRSKSLELQADIRSKIEEYGSRKAFFEAGGLSLLSKYKTDLLTSKETMQYKDNKANMERIFAAEKDGKGGNLSVIDMQNLKDYQNGNGDIITYSGLKSDIEIPQTSFDYGSTIAPEKILHGLGNYTKIYGNYIKDNPKMKGLTGKNLEDVLLEYTRHQYGQSQGLNQLHEQQRFSMAEHQAANKAVIDSATPKEDKSISLVSGISSLFTTANNEVPMTLDNLYARTHYVDQLAVKNPNVKALVNGNFTGFSIPLSKLTLGNTLNVFGDGIKNFTGYNNTYRPASASIVFKGSENKIIQELYKGQINKDGTVNYTNDENYINADGSPLNEDNDDPLKSNTAHVINLIMAPVDNDDKMIVEKLDSKGKRYTVLDKKSGKYVLDPEVIKSQKSLYSGDPKYKLFSVLKLSNGKLIYHKEDMNTFGGIRNFSNTMGANDNIAPVINDKQERQNKINASIKENTLHSQNISDEIMSASTPSKNGVFTQPAFINEAKSYTYTSGDNQTFDSNKLLKSFYSTYNYYDNNGKISAGTMKKTQRTDKAEFTTLVQQFPQLKNMLMDKKSHSDVKIINSFSDIVSSNVPEDKLQNDDFAKTWLQIYSQLSK